MKERKSDPRATQSLRHRQPAMNRLLIIIILLIALLPRIAGGQTTNSLTFIYSLNTNVHSIVLSPANYSRIYTQGFGSVQIICQSNQTLRVLNSYNALVTSGSATVTVSAASVGHYFVESQSGDRAMFAVLPSAMPAKLDFGTTTVTLNDQYQVPIQSRFMAERLSYARIGSSAWDTVMTNSNPAQADWHWLDYELDWAFKTNASTKVFFIMGGCSPSWENKTNATFFSDYQTYASNLFTHVNAYGVANSIDVFSKAVFELWNEPANDPSSSQCNTLPDSTQSGSTYTSNWLRAYADLATHARAAAAAVGVTVKLAGPSEAGYWQPNMNEWATNGLFAAVDVLTCHRYNDQTATDHPDSGSFSLLDQWNGWRSLTNCATKDIYYTEIGLGGGSALGVDYLDATNNLTTWHQGMFNAVKVVVLAKVFGVHLLPHLLASQNTVNDQYVGVMGYEVDGTISRGPQPKTTAIMCALNALNGRTLTSCNTNGVLRSFTFSGSLTVAWTTTGSTTNVAMSGAASDVYGNAVSYGGALTEQPVFFNSHLITCPVEP